VCLFDYGHPWMVCAPGSGPPKAERRRALASRFGPGAQAPSGGLLLNEVQKLAGRRAPGTPHSGAQLRFTDVDVVDQGRAGPAKQVQPGVEQQQRTAGPDQVGDAGLAPQPGPPCTPVNQR
jgi:hypothetical protein